MAYQMTLFKQSTVPSLLRNYYMPAVHGTGSSQLVIGNELTPFLAAVNDVGLQSFDDLIEGQEEQLFSVINRNPQHLLHHLLLPPSVASQNYELRHRTHNRSLPDRAGHLSDANFISRMIFKDTY